MIKALKAIGISAVADIVINHRCADAQDDNGVWNTFKYVKPSPSVCVYITRKVLCASPLCFALVSRNIPKGIQSKVSLPRRLEREKQRGGERERKRERGVGRTGVPILHDRFGLVIRPVVRCVGDILVAPCPIIRLLYLFQLGFTFCDPRWPHCVPGTS